MGSGEPRRVRPCPYHGGEPHRFRRRQMVKKREDKERSSRFYSILHVEIMFFHAARRHLELAKKGWSPIEKALNDLKALDEQWERLQVDDIPLGDSRLERIAVATERQFETVGFAYAPVLEHIAIVHLLCANCLEATINAIGKDLLDGSMFGEFDKLSLTGKWLFLPKIRELKGFDPGREPFQSFTQQSVSNSMQYFGRPCSNCWRKRESSRTTRHRGSRIFQRLALCSRSC